MPARDPTDLVRSPPAVTGRQAPPAPVIVALENLTISDGTKLELLTRTNPVLARAAQLGYIYSTSIMMADGSLGSPYVGGRIAQIERLAISMGGQGRTDQISALQAGGSMPDSYFERGKSAQYSAVSSAPDE